MHCARGPAASVTDVLLRSLRRLCGTVGNCHGPAGPIPVAVAVPACPAPLWCVPRASISILSAFPGLTNDLLALHDTLCNEVDASPKTYGFVHQRQTCWATPSPRHTLTRICDRWCMHTWPTCSATHDHQRQHYSIDPIDRPTRRNCVHTSSEDELPCPPAVARPCRRTTTVARVSIQASASIHRVYP